MTRGYTRVDAARFSFLIAVPAIGGAVTLHLRSILKGDLGTPLPVLATGVVVSFLVGLAALEWLLRIVARGRLHWFAWYCLIVGIGVIVWQFSLR
jgi:undecaprenyl-diphosphatase